MQERQKVQMSTTTSQLEYIRQTFYTKGLSWERIRRSFHLSEVLDYDVILDGLKILMTDKKLFFFF